LKKNTKQKITILLVYRKTYLACFYFPVKLDYLKNSINKKNGIANDKKTGQIYELGGPIRLDRTKKTQEHKHGWACGPKPT
jgi:hypothetical protein